MYTRDTFVYMYIYIYRCYIYIYIFLQAHSQRCFKHEIDIQRKSTSVKRFGKAFINNDCSK